jgi:hypothetical protein
MRIVKRVSVQTVGLVEIDLTMKCIRPRGRDSAGASLISEIASAEKLLSFCRLAYFWREFLYLADRDRGVG